MARMNVESSYAVSRLIELWCSNKTAYWDLISAAVEHLPAPRKTTARGRVFEQAFRDGLARNGQRFLSAPPEPGIRSLANTIAQWSFRNGEIENVHAGFAPFAYPLGARRISPAIERTIFREAAARFAGAAWGLMIPYAYPRSASSLDAYHEILTSGGMYPASDWTTTESSWPVEILFREPTPSESLSLVCPDHLTLMQDRHVEFPREWLKIRPATL
jgi:hypothetical protein